MSGLRTIRAVSGVRIPSISSRCLRYHSRRVDPKLGLVFNDNKVIRTIDGKVLDQRVFSIRHKLIYSDYLHEHQRLFSYPKRINALKSYMAKCKKVERQSEGQSPISLQVKNSLNEDGSQILSVNDNHQAKRSKIILSKTKHILKKYGTSFKDHLAANVNEIPKNWMTDYELYNDASKSDQVPELYGTPLADSKISKIQCGGCGAFLHCKDYTIPGYLPSEIFLGLDKNDLRTVICQRCHFLKNYNTALEVHVSPEDYPKMLQTLKNEKSTIILLIDVTDIPCSIWSEFSNILHPDSKVFIVGNKIDLLPSDGKLYLENVANLLYESVLSRTGVSEKQIEAVALISARTGFGIENFINVLFDNCKDKGSVHLVGCTNVGKSSVFNALVHSDYCAVSPEDVIQSATVSSWPGTTLNMLKFPIRPITMSEVAHRKGRINEDCANLISERNAKAEEFRRRWNAAHTILTGIVRRTPELTPLKVIPERFGSEKKEMLLDSRTRDSQEIVCHWCYDTPGTINSDQILDLLTIDELKLIRPDGIIKPRTFTISSGQTIFLAGLGRIDCLNESNADTVCCTLFASKKLPITICKTVFAEDVYKRMIQTEALVVPINDTERLMAWPALKSHRLQLTGIGVQQSAADIVLSSAGWVAIAAPEDLTLEFDVWTPQARGIHLRTPSMLSKSVCYRGSRVPGTPVYYPGKEVFFLEKVPTIHDDP